MYSNLTTKNPHLWVWFGPFGLGVWGSRPGPSCKGYDKRCCNVRPAYVYSGIAWMLMILDDSFSNSEKTSQDGEISQWHLSTGGFFLEPKQIFTAWSGASDPPEVCVVCLPLHWSRCRSPSLPLIHSTRRRFTQWLKRRLIQQSESTRWLRKIYQEGNNVSTTPTAGWLTQSQNDPMNFLSSFLLRTFALHPKN